MTNFKTLQDLWNALSRGHKITRHDWNSEDFLYLDKEILYNDGGNPAFYIFEDPLNWKIWEAPKAKKTTKHYRWLCFNPTYFKSNVYKHTEYFAEGETPEYGVKRLDNDYIIIAENNKIIDECINEN